MIVVYLQSTSFYSCKQKCFTVFYGQLAEGGQKHTKSCLSLKKLAEINGWKAVYSPSPNTGEVHAGLFF